LVVSSSVEEKPQRTGAGIWPGVVKKATKGGVKATYDASKATYDVFILAAKPLFSRGVVIKVLNSKVTTLGIRPRLPLCSKKRSS